MDVWIDLLQHMEIQLPGEMKHFYIVSEEMMKTYDNFQTQFRKSGINGIVRRENEIIKLWLQEDEEVVCGHVKVGALFYRTIKHNYMNRLCDFIQKAIEGSIFNLTQHFINYSVCIIFFCLSLSNFW